MSKVVGPLFSLDASGKFAKSLIFGSNQSGNWVRKMVEQTRLRTPAQAIMTAWFGEAMNSFKKMTEEEKWLWDLSIATIERPWLYKIEKLPRTPRCYYSHLVLRNKSLEFEGQPFPPNIYSLLASDEIAGFGQLISDLETLTGLVFCSVVKPYFFYYLGKHISPDHPDYGSTCVYIPHWRGSALALDLEYYYLVDEWDQKKVVVQGLTQCLLAQHAYFLNRNIYDAAIIADECGERVADNNLTPVYTYGGRTLSQIVPVVGCP